jgi:Ca-activated chloride channel family protein
LSYTTCMFSWRFRKYDPNAFSDNPFENLLKLFKELLMFSSGNVNEALSWLTELDKKYNLTKPDYGIADFIREMKEKGYLKEDGKDRKMVPAAKMEIELRRKALEDVFDDLKKSKRGDHKTNAIGLGDEVTSEIKPYEWGDSLDQIAVSETIKNAHINHGIEEFSLTQEDMQIHESFYQSQMSTVLMIDVSHSMILYGEDRITPAKKVAMALSELITTRYPKDTLDIIVFGDDAWQIEIKDLPYLQVGPYHTNTVAGLELAMEILRKRRNPNKQIMMITDGKPTCIKIGKKYYQNAFGLDKKILTRCFALAVKCRKQNIPITTFMIARDPWLVQFVDQFTKANDGKAFYSSLEGLGSFIFLDYKQNKRKFKR